MKISRSGKITWGKILNLELSFETQSSKNFISKILLFVCEKENQLRFVVYLFFLLFNISTERLNKQPNSLKEVFTNAICCIKQLKNIKCNTSFGNSKHVKKIIGAFSVLQTPSCVLSLALHACSLKNSIFYTKNGQSYKHLK